MNSKDARSSQEIKKIISLEKKLPQLKKDLKACLNDKTKLRKFIDAFKKTSNNMKHKLAKKEEKKI